MTSSKSNQGKQWEKMLEVAFSGVSHCDVVKTDPPVRYIKPLGAGMFQAVFLAPGQCDFEGDFRGVPVCLDAKETKTTMFLKDRIKKHQWDRMAGKWERGGISGLLLRFQSERAENDGMYLVTYPMLEKMFAKKKRFTSLELAAGANPSTLKYRPLHGGKIGVVGLEPILNGIWAERTAKFYENRTCNSAGSLI